MSAINEKTKLGASALITEKASGRSSPSSHPISTEGALTPDKGTEKDFNVPGGGANPFGVTPGELNKMQNPKSLAAFKALGGLPGLERALRTDINAGLSVDEGKLTGTVPRAAEWLERKIA